MLAILVTGICFVGAHAQGGQAESRAATDSLFTNGGLRVIKLDIAKVQLSALRRDPRSYVRATVRDGAITHSNVLIRLKGGAGSFRPLGNKPGFTLKFEKATGFFHGLKKFHLNNSVQDGTYLSEWVCGELFRQAGVPMPRAIPVMVELNGQRLGMYVLLESVDQQFLSRYFKTTDGNVYSPSMNADITASLACIGGRENNNRADLRALAAAAREPGGTRLRQLLDVDRFLSFLAMEVMLCHWDGYTFNVKNYLVFHDLDAQKMVFIPHDLDQMLQDSNRPVLPQATGIVSRSIFSNPETRKLYLERFRQLYPAVFVAPAINQQKDSLVARLSPALNAYDTGVAWEFAHNADSLKSRITQRARFLAHYWRTHEVSSAR